MKAICTTWFLPADYCGCAKCMGVTPSPVAGAGETGQGSFVPLNLNQLGAALATVANMEGSEE